MGEKNLSTGNENEREATADTTPEGKSTVLPLAAIGLLLGIGAAILQLRIARFGGLSNEQLPLFWGFFIVAGLVLSVAGGSVVRFVLSSRGAPRASVISGGFITALLFFLLFVPFNTRELPNVYLLVTDTTRSDHLSLYGYERKTTPFLDEIRDECVVFSNNVSQGSHTIVTTPCILASCYPSEHGITGYSDVLSPSFTLISEYLRESGYRTYGYATNPHLGPRAGYAQGFDRYAHDPGWAHTPAAVVNRRFLNWVDETDERPIFGYLFYIDPHNPYKPPAEFQTMFDPDWEGDPISDWHPEPPDPPAPDTLRNLVAQYDGSIAYWDDEFRKLVLALENRDLYRNSILVYTADHGEEFWEHGHWGHNRTLFEESIGVPLVLSFPSPFHFPPLGRPTRVVEEVSSSVDIVPTILDFLRIMPDPNARGRSLMPLVYKGKESGPEQRAYCEEILERYGPYDVRALRSKDRKYVMTFNYEGARDLDDLFFDLTADPGEKRNAMADFPEEAAEFRANLAAMVKEISRFAPARVDTIAIDEATRERLKALGYLQ